MVGNFCNRTACRIRNRRRRHDSNMTLRKKRTPRASLHYVGWRAWQKSMLLPVAGEVFLLTLPFIERRYRRSDKKNICKGLPGLTALLSFGLKDASPEGHFDRPFVFRTSSPLPRSISQRTFSDSPECFITCCLTLSSPYSSSFSICGFGQPVRQEEPRYHPLRIPHENSRTSAL